MSNVAKERTARLFLVKETVEDALEVHAAANSVRHEGAEIPLPRPRNLVEDRDGSAAAGELIRLAREGGFTYPETHLRPPGTLIATAEQEALLEALFGSVITVLTAGKTTVADVAATTTVIDLTAVTDLQAGDFIYFVGPGEGSIIESIAGNEVTLAIPLSSAPADATEVLGGKQYRPLAAGTENPTLSAILDLDVFQRVSIGVTANEGSIRFTQGDSIKLSATGHASGKRSYVGESSVADAGGVDGVTDPVIIEIPAGDHFKFRVDDGDLFVQIEDEVLKVTAVDRTSSPRTLTADRAQKTSGIAAHANGTAITPWQAAATKTGSPLVGITGRGVIVLDGVRYAFKLREAVLNVANGYVRVNDYGEDHQNDRFRQGTRPRQASNWSVTARMDPDLVRLWGAAEQVTAPAIVVWGGNVEGRIMGAGSRVVDFEVPDPSSGGGDQVTLPLTGQCLEATLGNADEYRFAIL
jgi:hypothetical protein